MADWKYKIGDMVTPAVMGDFGHPVKMIITGRVTEEYADHTERYYVCSNFKLGDYVRQRMAEIEIIPAATAVKP